MLNPRAIAVMGVGYGALLDAVHGLLPFAATDPTVRGCVAVADAPRWLVSITHG